jgi:hypothetical protein
MSDEQQIRELKAEVAACIKFLRSEMEWEYFRAEFKIDSEAKANNSAENARLIRNFLSKSGRGIELLAELDSLRAKLAASVHREKLLREALELSK